MLTATLTDEQVKNEARKLVARGPRLVSVDGPGLSEFYAVRKDVFEGLVNLAERPHD